MKLILKVECNHPEFELGNISTKLVDQINEYEDKIASVYQCPICKRQIVISLERSP